MRVAAEPSTRAGQAVLLALFCELVYLPPLCVYIRKILGGG